MGTNETAIWIGPLRVFQTDTGSGIGKKWYVRQATYPLSEAFDTQQAAIDYAVERYRIQVECNTHNENWDVIRKAQANH